MNRRKRLTFEIALAGISTALSLVCTVLYYYVPLAKLSFLALSAVALILPLCVDSVRGAALAYLAASGLSIAVMGPIPALPFVFLFGWQPVVMGACLRFLPRKPYVSLPIKAALFNAGLYGVYTLYGLGQTFGNALQRIGAESVPYWAVALVGTVLWLLYDYAMVWVWRWLDRRLDKVTAKYRPPRKADTAEKPPINAEGEGASARERDDVGSVFGEYGETPVDPPEDKDGDV